MLGSLNLILFRSPKPKKVPKTPLRLPQGPLKSILRKRGKFWSKHKVAKIRLKTGWLMSVRVGTMSVNMYGPTQAITTSKKLRKLGFCSSEFRTRLQKGGHRGPRRPLAGPKHISPTSILVLTNCQKIWGS